MKVLLSILLLLVAAHQASCNLGFSGIQTSYPSPIAISQTNLNIYLASSVGKNITFSSTTNVILNGVWTFNLYNSTVLWSFTLQNINDKTMNVGVFDQNGKTIFYNSGFPVTVPVMTIVDFLFQVKQL